MADSPELPFDTPPGDTSPSAPTSESAAPATPAAQAIASPPAATGVASVADVADDVEHRHDPRSVTVSRIAGGIAVVLVAAAQAIASLVLLVVGIPGFVLLLILTIFAVVLGLMGSAVWFRPALRYRYAAYRVNERGIHIRDGVLWRSLVSVPRSRVQHTDVSQGPLERNYGLATLIIHTAGTEHASVALSGLPRDKAYAIRDHLIEGGTDDAV